MIGLHFPQMPRDRSGARGSKHILESQQPETWGKWRVWRGVEGCGEVTAAEELRAAEE
jgi:hypothetical protein